MDKCFYNVVGIVNQSVIFDNQMIVFFFYNFFGVNDVFYYGCFYGKRGDGWCVSIRNGNDWL